MKRLPGQRAAKNGFIAGFQRGASSAAPSPSLRLHIALTRLGWLRGGSVLLLVIGLLAWLVAIPWGQQHLATRQVAIEAASEAAQRHATSVAQGQTADDADASHATARLAQFRAALGDAREIEAHLKSLYAIARQSGLVVDQAEYHFANDAHDQYQTCQVSLPLGGSYANLRHFAEQALRTMPFLALDEFSLWREDIHDTQVQARLRFTLFLTAPQQTAEAPQ